MDNDHITRTSKLSGMVNCRKRFFRTTFITVIAKYGDMILIAHNNHAFL